MAKNNNIRFLEKHKIPFQTIEYTYHEEDLSLITIAKENHLALTQIFKTLVNIANTGEIIIALVAGNQEINHKKLAQLAQVKKIEMAHVKDLQKLTGYMRGACSPLGLKKPYRIFIDHVLNQYEQVYINAGQRGLLLGLSPQDLVKITQATIADIAL